MCHSLIVAVLLSLGFATHVFAAPTIVDHFLLAALTDVDSLANLPETPEGVNSWVEQTQIQVNLRTRTSTDETTDQSTSNTYAIRIQPKAWGQREAELKILALRAHQQEAGYQQALNKAFTQRYLILLQLISQQQQTRQLLLNQQLLAKEVQLQRLQVNSPSFNPEALLSAELNLTQAEGALRLNIQRPNQLQQKLHFPLDNPTTLVNNETLSWLLTPPELPVILAKEYEQRLSPEIQQAQLNLDLARAEHQRIQARQSLAVNQVGVQFQDSRQDKFGFMFGINIPLGRENFLATDKRYDVLKANDELSNKTADLAQGLADKITQVTHLAEDWQMRQEQLKHLANLAARLNNNYAQTNLQLRLKLEKEMLKQGEELTLLHQQALNSYLDALSLSGQLLLQPLRNWFSKGNPVLSTKF